MEIEFIYKQELRQLILYYVKFKKYKYVLLIKDQFTKTQCHDYYKYVLIYQRLDFEYHNKQKVELYEIMFNQNEWKKMLNEDLKNVLFEQLTARKLFDLFKKELNKLLNGEVDI